MVRSGEKADRSAERTPYTWAALAAALAVTASPTAVLAQLAPPAPEPAEAPASTARVTLEADELINDDAAGTITAEGDVQVRYMGRTLRADRLVYNLNSGEIRAVGNVEVVLENGSVTYAEQVEADEALNIGVASELRARLSNDATLAARAAFRHGEGESELRNLIYTSCPICEAGDRPPTWSLRARRAIQDRESRTLSYQGAVLEVVGVPVLYLPYFMHPDPSVGRASGFLTPDVGRNRRTGAHYTQPYYWAISPSQDVTVSLRVNENVNPLGNVQYRRRFWSGELEIDASFTHEAEFDGEGRRFGEEELRGSLFAAGRWRANEDWVWGFGVERVSDDLFLNRYDIRGAGELRGPYYGYHTRLLNQLYAIGQDRDFYASTSFLSFQGLWSGYPTHTMPNVLPYSDIEWVLNEDLLGGQVRVNSNVVVLSRNDNAVVGSTARASLGASWRRDLIFGPGLVFSPFGHARGDLYHVEDIATGEFETFGRSLGLAGAELSWPFMRVGERVDFVIEPVVMAAYGSEDANDPRIVNEDSLGFEIDDSNLFRPNGAPNYDLWEQGGRIAAGVRATARAHTGESLSIILGRRWRDEPDPSFAPRTNLSGTTSDWVASGQINLGRLFSAEARVRLDEETLDVERVDVSARGRIGRFSASARYYQLQESFVPGNPLHQISWGVGVDLARGWRMTAGVSSDLDSDINLSEEIRAIYEDDCTFLEITYGRRETFVPTLGPEESIQIRVGLRSLGLFGGD